MEDNKMNGHVDGCKCLSCKGHKCFRGHGGRFSILRFLIVLVFLCLIFSAGREFGEMRAYRGGLYGQQNGWRGGMNYNGWGRGMMSGYGRQGIVPVSEVSNVVSTATTTVK